MSLFDLLTKLQEIDKDITNSLTCIKSEKYQLRLVDIKEIIQKAIIRAAIYAGKD